MTDDNQDFLDSISLNANEWRGVNELANAQSDLEPLAKRSNLGQTIADRLVAIGLAEEGPVNTRYAAIGYKTGYRLTDLGWKVRERGRHPLRK